MKVEIFCAISVLLSSMTQGKGNRSENLISLINKPNSTWTAGQNFPNLALGSLENLKLLTGVLGFHPDPNFQIAKKTHDIRQMQIPENFDAREQWPECADVIGNIRNQGQCGTCWAFAPAEVMTDKLCLRSQGKVKFESSPEDIISCCKGCHEGCIGGYTAMAWSFLQTNGVVSGGDYNSFQGCKPYPESEFQSNVTNSCQLSCTNDKYTISYQDDKHFINNFYQLYQDVQQIQAEILNNGPVQASYVVYEDFLYYQEGVYQHVTGGEVGGHAVKIIGWGTENDIPYWLVANSWGSDWGKLDGFFKIARGKNECGIEQQVHADVTSHPANLLLIIGLLFVHKLKHLLEK